MSTPTVVLTRQIAAPCADVFRAWRDPALVVLWLAPGAVVVEHAAVDFRIGGTFRLETRGPDGSRHRITGVYREIATDRRIVQTWIYDGPLDLEVGHTTILEVDLRPLDDGVTELTLTHRDIVRAEVRAAYAGDWPSCLDKLEAALS